MTPSTDAALAVWEAARRIDRTMSSAEYHAHPALGSTGARVIVNECPAMLQAPPPEPKTAFDIGNATHLLVLQPEDFQARTGIIDAFDYRKPETRTARDDIRLDGRIPLLRDEYEAVVAMRDAILRDPIAGVAFKDGIAEQSMFWTDPATGVECKVRPDWVPSSGAYLIDVKTSASANPDDFQGTIGRYGYHQQAAWYLDGVKAVLGIPAQRFAFVVVQKTPPHLVSVCWLDDEAIEWGRILNRYARGVFAWCKEHDTWPGYVPAIGQPPRAFTVGLPAWSLKNLQARHEAGAFEPPIVERELAA